MADNIALIEGVREIVVFTEAGNVLTHNIKAFAVKKAVLVFLFHHFTSLAAQAASQLTPIRFLASSGSSKLLVGRLVDDVFVAVTGDSSVDHDRIFNYLKTCSQAQG
jgi:hypothetical protein